MKDNSERAKQQQEINRIDPTVINHLEQTLDDILAEDPQYHRIITIGSDGEPLIGTPVEKTEVKGLKGGEVGDGEITEENEEG